MKKAVLGLTLGGNVFAVVSCVLLAAGSLGPAFVCVVAAMVLDMLDGPLAHKFGVSSKSGGWLDALTDVCVYVLFPAIFWLQTYNLQPVALAIFAGAGVFRLVRFTLQGFQTDNAKLFYPGMPVFYSQFLLILTYAVHFDAFVLSLLLLGVAALNVSLIPFVKIPVRGLSAGLVIYVAIVVMRLSNAL